uniref:NADH-ubiquinone oxidoreductase chain 1 n=1 Tax=Pediastrum duplex TaxID=3105 RepID=A0A2Z4EL22_PEDDU|nr:NADH dehydrogenase subunit 1 [Pediastrum duplex]
MALYVLVQVLGTVVPLLLAVLFLTLVERRVMALMQRRQGPNVWGFGGFLQPFLDGLKLFLKEPVLPSNADGPLFVWAPILTFLTSQLTWAALPTSSAGAISDLNLGTMYVLLVGSLGVYGILLAGWSSNSKYAFLGCCRSVAQMISYELPLGLVVLTVCLLLNSLNWHCLVDLQNDGWNILPLWPLFFIWMVCLLAETNRLPFDLPEAELELVLGYFVEYLSISFLLFFIAEYLSIIMISSITVILFFGGVSAPLQILSWMPGSFWLLIKTTAIVFTFVWVRLTLPRYRYDQLMNLGWKAMLPITLAAFVFNLTLVLCFQLV